MGKIHFVETDDEAYSDEDEDGFDYDDYHNEYHCLDECILKKYEIVSTKCP